MQSTESGFNELVYLAASQEHLMLSEHLLNQGHHVIASYLAGVAVEALFLAYQTRAKAPHDARHSLWRLAENGKFWEGMTRPQKEAITAALTEVMTRWRNNHRYRSEQALHEFFVKEKLFVVSGNQTTREDVVKFNADLLVESATRILEVGVARWSLNLS